MPVEFKQATLDNGLTIIAEVDPAAHTSAAGFFVKTGARDEARPVMGVSHFLEHMMFKGTQRRSADDVNREFDEIGARYNAYTSHETTCFYAGTLPEFLGQGIDILADILRPALRQEDFDAEKGVILEEIAMYKDQPFWRLYEVASEKRYPGHAMGFRVLGTEESIEALTRDQMQTYFDERYSADNTTVALAGRLDFDRAVDEISALCAGWARTGASRDNHAPAAGDEAFTMRDERVTRAYMLMLAPGPGAQDPRRYAATMLAQALGAGDNSRLHWALIEPGLADEAQASFETHDGVGDFFIYASCTPDRAESVWSIVEKEVGALGDAITDDDLERQRSRIATGVTVAGEQPGGRMQRLGRTWQLLGEYVTLEEELARISAVTLDDVRAVYDSSRFTPRVVGKLLPAD